MSFTLPFVLLFFQSWPFHQPVKKKFVKDYYDIIKKPMDLTRLLKVHIPLSYNEYSIFTELITDSIVCYFHQCMIYDINTYSIVFIGTAKYNHSEKLSQNFRMTSDFYLKVNPCLLKMGKD